MRVLVGLNGGDQSIAVLERTIERAQQTDDELTVALFESPSGTETVPELREQAREVLADHDVEAELWEFDENPGSKLVEAAEAEGFDQLVITDGEPTPMGKIHLDSVSQFVLFNSQVTVKLVR